MSVLLSCTYSPYSVYSMHSQMLPSRVDPYSQERRKNFQQGSCRCHRSSSQSGPGPLRWVTQPERHPRRRRFASSSSPSLALRVHVRHSTTLAILHAAVSCAELFMRSSIYIGILDSPGLPCRPCHINVALHAMQATATSSFTVGPSKLRAMSRPGRCDGNEVPVRDVSWI